MAVIPEIVSNAPMHSRLNGALDSILVRMAGRRLRLNAREGITYSHFVKKVCQQ